MVETHCTHHAIYYSTVIIWVIFCNIPRKSNVNVNISISPHLPVAVLDSGVSVAPTAAAVVGAPLTDITMSTKAMSVVSVTSQCSYSSTIVHVPQPESGA